MTEFREFLCYFIMLFSYIVNVDLLENGLARTPPMGWMSWGYYMCGDYCINEEKCLNEKLITSVADAFYTEGYQEAGFEYIIIDDCWSERERRGGKLVPNYERFPRGMKFLADYIHKRGLKFGMYLNIASETCMHYPGSKGHFSVDAKSLAGWDVDYIKVDGCYVELSYLDEAYIEMGDKLNKTGRPMVYTCSWPFYSRYVHTTTPDYGKCMKYCNLWRNFYDTKNTWRSVMLTIEYFVEAYEEISKYHGPGHWNDPDMLAFGSNTLTEGQSKIQISVYAMLSAPLLISCPMNKLKAFEKKLLLNHDLIAIDQDPLGIMARPYKINEDQMLWVKVHLPAKGNSFFSYSIAAVNYNSYNTGKITFTPRRYSLNATEYTLYDVLLRKYVKNVTLDDLIEFEVPSMDVVLATLYPL